MMGSGDAARQTMGLMLRIKPVTTMGFSFLSAQCGETVYNLLQIWAKMPGRNYCKVSGEKALGQRTNSFNQCLPKAAR